MFFCSPDDSCCLGTPSAEAYIRRSVKSAKYLTLAFTFCAIDLREYASRVASRRVAVGSHSDPIAPRPGLRPSQSGTVDDKPVVRDRSYCGFTVTGKSRVASPKEITLAKRTRYPYGSVEIDKRVTVPHTLASEHVPRSQFLSRPTSYWEVTMFIFRGKNTPCREKRRVGQPAASARSAPEPHPGGRNSSG